MRELIEKQAAITMPVMPKEHRAYQTLSVDGVYEQGWHDCQTCIEDLPSAQLEPNEEAEFWRKRSDEYLRLLFSLMGDSIEGIKFDVMEFTNDGVLFKASKLQQEVITCEHCAKCQIDDVYHEYWCDGRKVRKDHYCGYAEGREDE